MEGIFTLIDERVRKYLSNSPYIVSVPCVVKALGDDGLVEVELVSNKARYTVPNWSGSPIEVGENVQLFYKGNILTEQTAYVGASLNKNTGGGSVAFNSVSGEVIATGLSGNEELLSYMTVANFSNSVILSVNLTFKGDSSNAGNGTISVYVDETEQTYTPIFNVGVDEYETLSFSLPLNLAIGSHYIEVKGTGEYADLLSGCVFAYGDIDEYNSTNESDYYYIIENGVATITEYIGSSICPRIPTTLDGAIVTTIDIGAFSDTEVRNVYIPEGIEEIK
jgi:hypothetical protein